MVEVTAFRFTCHVLLVTAIVALVWSDASMTTVPEPHPDTVHNLTFTFNVGVCASPIVKIPEPWMLYGFGEFNKPAGKLTSCKV